MSHQTRSRRAQWLRRAVLVAIAVAVIGAVVTAMLPKPVGVDLATVQRGPLRVTVDEDGQTRIKERYVVSSPLSGRLLRIGLNVGDPVVAGETVLARIQPTDPELLDPRATAQAQARVKAAEARLAQAATQLERTQAALDFAESEVARVRRLVEQTAATPSQLEGKELNYRTTTEEFKAAKFGEEIARFELELERAALLRTQGEQQDSTNGSQPEATDVNSMPAAATGEDAGGNGEFLIRAPISGRVLKLVQESATIASPGMELVELGDPLDLEVVVDVLSSDAVRIVSGAKALLDQWGGEEPLSATVRLIEPSGFTKVSALGVEEQRVNVVLDFENPPEDRRTLGDNFRVEARIVVWEEEEVLKVPTSSLFREERKWAAFVIEEETNLLTNLTSWLMPQGSSWSALVGGGERARLRTIEVGRQNGLEAQVISGLEAGEQIVTHPSDQVVDGVGVFTR